MGPLILFGLAAGVAVVAGGSSPAARTPGRTLGGFGGIASQKATMPVHTFAFGGAPVVAVASKDFWRRPGARALSAAFYSFNGSPLLDDAGFGPLVAQAMNDYKRGLLSDADARKIATAVILATSTTGIDPQGLAGKSNAAYLSNPAIARLVDFLLAPAFAELGNDTHALFQWLQAFVPDCGATYWGTWTLADLYDRTAGYWTAGNNGDCGAIAGKVAARIAQASSSDVASLRAAIRDATTLRLIAWPGGPPSAPYVDWGQVLTKFATWAAASATLVGFAGAAYDSVKWSNAKIAEWNQGPKACPSCYQDSYGLGDLFMTAPYWDAEILQDAAGDYTTIGKTFGGAAANVAATGNATAPAASGSAYQNHSADDILSAMKQKAQAYGASVASAFGSAAADSLGIDTTSVGDAIASLVGE